MSAQGVHARTELNVSTFQEVIAAVANLVMKAETVKKVRKKLHYSPDRP